MWVRQLSEMSLNVGACAKRLVVLAVGVECAPAPRLAMLATTDVAPVLFTRRAPTRTSANVVAFVAVIVRGALATTGAGLAGRV